MFLGNLLGSIYVILTAFVSMVGRNGNTPFSPLYEGSDLFLVERPISNCIMVERNRIALLFPPYQRGVFTFGPTLDVPT